jgi:hypothetical protein
LSMLRLLSPLLRGLLTLRLLSPLLHGLLMLRLLSPLLRGLLMLRLLMFLRPLRLCLRPLLLCLRALLFRLLWPCLLFLGLAFFLALVLRIRRDNRPQKQQQGGDASSSK